MQLIATMNTSHPVPSQHTAPLPSASDMLRHVSRVFALLSNRDWDKFKLLTYKNPLAFRALDNVLATSAEFSGVTFLHAAARYDPPIEIIDIIVKICPESPRARDCLNRTPLHVASGAGASVGIIKYLVHAYPDACTIQDEDGRTPLHFACDSECLLFEGDQDQKDPPSFEIVYALLSGSVTSASMEDEDEISPLEYAILSNADVKVVKILQQAAQSCMKKSHAAAAVAS